MVHNDETEVYHYEITDIQLIVTGIEVTDSLLRQHQALLSKHNAQYHLKSSTVKTYSVPSNLKAWSLHNFFQVS